MKFQIILWEIIETFLFLMIGLTFHRNHVYPHPLDYGIALKMILKTSVLYIFHSHYYISYFKIYLSTYYYSIILFHLSRLWCLFVTLSLSHWYPGSGVVLGCIDSWFLPSYLLLVYLIYIIIFIIYFDILILFSLSTINPFNIYSFIYFDMFPIYVPNCFALLIRCV